MWRLSQLSLKSSHIIAFVSGRLSLEPLSFATFTVSLSSLHNKKLSILSSEESFACAFACCSNDEIKREADPLCLYSYHGGSHVLFLVVQTNDEIKRKVDPLCL